MECEYYGHFEEQHNTKKKRRLAGQAKLSALNSILDKGKSCETFREIEAVRIMSQGIFHNFIVYSMYNLHH